MTIGEMNHGRGTPMSAHELTVFWPIYFETTRRIQARQERNKRRGG